MTQIRLWIFGLLIAISALFFVLPGMGQRVATHRATPEESLRGHFLVASAGLGDPHFRRTVVFLLEHNTDGAFGLVVNVPARDMKLSELVSATGLNPPAEDLPLRVHYGGPVQLDYVFVLHSAEVDVEASREVIEGLQLSTHPDFFRLVGEGKAPRSYRIFNGYSGWAPGQLENELSTGSWITVRATASKIFDVKPDELWEVLMKGHRL